MDGNDAVEAVARGLDALGIAFLLVGSFASNHHGIDRSTQDADFLIDPGDLPLGPLFRSLRPAIRFDPQQGFETVTMTRRHRAEVDGTPFTIELFELSDDPHDRERFARRVPMSFQGRTVPILSLEDVIVTKLRWARGKDRDDIRGVIAVQGDDRIDWDYVHGWADRHGTRALLDTIRASIPPI